MLMLSPNRLPNKGEIPIMNCRNLLQLDRNLIVLVTCRVTCKRVRGATGSENVEKQAKNAAARLTIPRFAKAAYGSNCTAGSNPALSADQLVVAVSGEISLSCSLVGRLAQLTVPITVSIVAI